MKNTIEEERWGWIAPIITNELSYEAVLKLCPHSKRSLERWVAAYRSHGMAGLTPRSTAPKTQPHETPIRLKEEVIALRKKTGLCAQKLHWRLKKQGLVVPRSTIAKILKTEGLVRKYRQKKVRYKYLRAERKPGELLEMDVKYVPGRIRGRRYYQYTVVDTATRWRHLEVFDEQSTSHAVRMMDMVDSGEPDAKIIGVPVNDPRWSEVNDMGDVNQHTLKEIEHFFLTYKQLQNKKVEIHGWKGAKEARDAFLRSQKLYKEKFAK